jgi:phosphatidylserine decarboxylase
MGIIELILAGVQHVLPHHLLSRIIYAFMRIRIAPIKDVQIHSFAYMAGVDWSESKKQQSSDFEHFNAFFTRELIEGARPLDPDLMTYVSPCDGRISQCGRITNNRILQAKGQNYSLQSLLVNDSSAKDFRNGFFHTIYLAPHDYHRVHMPVTGMLRRMIHVPGRLFSVAPYTTRQIPNLFTRNERLICLFETSHGPMSVILVGAMMVSSMETVWSGVVKPHGGKRVVSADLSRRGIKLRRGKEMGRFNMGSTVILLLPPGAISTLADYTSDDPVLMGQKLGRLR